MSRKYGNQAKVVGILSNKTFNKDAGAGLGRLGIMAGDSLINVNLWEKTDDEGNPIGVVKRFVENLEEGKKYHIRGELNERFYDEEYRRNITNRFIGDSEVYNVDQVDEENEEYSRVKLSGDIIEKNLELVKEVRGQSVDEDTKKITTTIVIYNQFNPESGEEDLTPRAVLGREIEMAIDRNDNNKVFKGMASRLKNNEDMKTFYDVLGEFLEKADRIYNIEDVHLCAYGNFAEKFNDKVKISDNITVGCDINTQTIRDEYDVVQGNLNEIEIMSFGGINEEGKLASSDSFDEEDFGEW